MIRDITIDQVLIELKRTEKALLALRAARKSADIVPAFRVCENPGCCLVNSVRAHRCYGCGGTDLTIVRERNPVHATAKRASLDLTRKLADLRAGR